jgi:hypothetical protein
MLLIMPEVTALDGDKMGFSIHYWRNQLGDIETKAEPEDAPIKPGGTYIFSFPESKQLSWTPFRRRENKPDPNKLRLNFQILSFGDGTGFVGNSGLPVPRPPNERSSLERCKPAPSLNDSGGGKARQASWRSQPTIFSIDDLPAQFLLANFLSPEPSEIVSLRLNPQVSTGLRAFLYSSFPIRHAAFCACSPGRHFRLHCGALAHFDVEMGSGLA